MSASDYATRADVKLHLQIATDATFLDSWIDWIIPIISRAIDDHCHRHFWPKTATKIFDYQTAQRLFFKADLWEVTEILHGVDTLEVLSPSSYFLYPEVGPPYQWLEINESSIIRLRYTRYTPQQSISVEGVWGYLEDGATPNRVNWACCAWISYLHKLGKNAGVKSKSIGDYSISYSSTLDYLRNGPPNEADGALGTFIRRSNFGSNLRYKG
jgi:hypothetical protein